MKKIRKIGWIGKDNKIGNLLMKEYTPIGIWYINYVYTTKGTKEMWEEWEWPPKKVEIIIREVK